MDSAHESSSSLSLFLLDSKKYWMDSAHASSSSLLLLLIDGRKNGMDGAHASSLSLLLLDGNKPLDGQCACIIIISIIIIIRQ